MDLELYRQAIGEHMPWVAVERMESILEGWSSIVIVVNDEDIFRFSRNVPARCRLATEIHTLRELEKALSIQAPRVEYSWLPEDEQELAFIVYKKIAGEALNHRLTASKDISTQLGALLTEIHSLYVSHDLRHALPNYQPAQWRQEYVDLYSWAKRDVYPRLGEEARFAEDAIWQGYLDQPLNFSFHPRFIHGDLGAEHILCNPQRMVVTGIIDWEDAAIGDPAIDFVGLNLVGGREFTDRVLGFYRCDTGENFWRRLSFYQAIIPYHEYRFGVEIGDEDHIRVALGDIMRRIGIPEE